MVAGLRGKQRNVLPSLSETQPKIRLTKRACGYCFNKPSATVSQVTRKFLGLCPHMSKGFYRFLVVVRLNGCFVWLSVSKEGASGFELS